jgi:plasmid stabilization system protein ParE
MNSYILFFHPLAEFELYESINYYQAKSDLATNKFKTELKETIHLIEQNPKLFPVKFSNKRHAPLKNFPYSLIYIVHKRNVYVLSIFHQSMNPKIWKNRKW